MNKLKIISIIVVIIMGVFLAKYIKERKTKYDYITDSFFIPSKGSFLFEVVHLALKEQPNITKKEIEEEFQRRPIYYNYHSTKNIKYNTFISNDSLYIYEFGFDGKDDFFKLNYNPEDISFFKSFFIKGDILLYKNSIYPVRKESEIIDSSLDSLAPPRPLLENTTNR